MHHYIHNFVHTPLSQKSILYPSAKNLEEVESEQQMQELP